jgi:antitoxin YefM
VNRSNQTTLTEANQHLAELCSQVIADRDVVIITRPNDGENVALIAEDELKSLMETVYLLRSPKNAARLLSALEEAKARTMKPQSLKELRQELEIGEEG